MREENIVKAKEKKQKNKLILTAVITAVISVFISFGIFFLVFFSGNKYVKLRELDYFISNYFYGETDTEKIVDSLLSGYVYALDDKYANYYNAENAQSREDSLMGNAKGIGIIVTNHPDTNDIYVKRVYDNCPAATAGIKAGDRITAIDGVSVLETGYAAAVDSILREIGDTVELTVLRDGEAFDVEVEYSEFTAQSVFYQLFEGGIGYIEITAFNAETVAQFENAVNDLMVKGAKSLIFDLRGNGGGTVDSVTEMVDFLVPEGVIMSAKYADGKKNVIAKSGKDEIELPMVVLTDNKTASASELFTASIKEFGKGISVGTTTYGKGVMQSTYGFSDGSSVVFTVAEFYSHSGNSFNEKGIAPDIEVKLNEEQEKYFHQLEAENDPVVTAAVGYLNDYEK